MRVGSPLLLGSIAFFLVVTGYTIHKHNHPGAATSTAAVTSKPNIRSAKDKTPMTAAKPPPLTDPNVVAMASAMKVSSSSDFTGLAYPASENVGCCHLLPEGTTREGKLASSCDTFCPVTSHGDVSTRMISLSIDEPNAQLYWTPLTDIFVNRVFEIATVLGYTKVGFLKRPKRVYVNHATKELSVDPPYAHIPRETITVLQDPRNAISIEYMSNRKFEDQTFAEWCDPLHGYNARSGCAFRYVNHAAVFEGHMGRSAPASASAFFVTLKSLITRPEKILGQYISFLGFTVPENKKAEVQGLISSTKFQFPNEDAEILLNPSLWSDKFNDERKANINVWSCDKAPVMCNFYGINCE